MRNERVFPARVKPSPARWVALAGLLGLLASPALATPPPLDSEVEALLASLRRDQAAARDGLAALRAEPLAATGADAVLTDLDAFFEGEGKRQLGLAAREAGLELARVPIPEGALELLLAELHTVVGGQGVEGVAHRFTERAEGPIAAVLDARMATLRSALDTRIGEALGGQMLEIQGKFDAVVAARFPAWEAAVVVPILPAPGLEVPADAQGQLVDADRRLRWGARAGLMAAPFAARIGARLGADLGRQATERAVQSVSRKVAGRLAGALTGIGAVLAAADTLIDLATIRERYRDELVRVMAAALRESLTPALVWRGTGDATPRIEVHQRVETKLAAWIEEAARRSEAVVEAGPALSSPQAREFIVKVMADGGDRDALLARLTTLQRTFGPALAGRHPLGVLDAMLQHGEPATVGTLAARLGDQLVVLYQQHGPELLRAADRLGPAILLESLGDPSIDWRALATSLPPGASPEAARGALLSLRLGLDPLALGSRPPIWPPSPPTKGRPGRCSPPGSPRGRPPRSCSMSTRGRASRPSTRKACWAPWPPPWGSSACAAWVGSRPWPPPSRGSTATARPPVASPPPPGASTSKPRGAWRPSPASTARRACASTWPRPTPAASAQKPMRPGRWPCSSASTPRFCSMIGRVACCSTTATRSTAICW